MTTSGGGQDLSGTGFRSLVEVIFAPCQKPVVSQFKFQQWAGSRHPGSDPQQTSRPRWKALRSPLLNAETPSSRLSLTGCNPLQAEWATGKGTFVRTFSVRARHQPDFEWRAERESCTVNPVQEYAPIRAELCDQASLAACGARCGSESVTLSAPAVVAIGLMPAISGCRSEGSSDGAVGLRPS